MIDYLVFIPFSAFISVLYIFANISGQRKNAVVNKSFLVFFFFLMIPPLIDFLVHLPFSVNFVLFLYQISIPFMIPLGFLYLNFVYALINKERDLSYWLSITLVVISIIYLDFIPPVTIAEFPGYQAPLPVPSWGFLPPFIFTLLAIPLYASMLCLKFIKKKDNIILSKQLRLVAIGAFISTPLSVITLFGHLVIHSFITLRFVSLGIFFNAVFMFIAVQRHFLLSVNFVQIENAFNRLFENSHDSVILLDEQGNAIQVNDSAKSLLSTYAINCNKESLERCINGYKFSINGTEIDATLKIDQEIKHLNFSQSLVKSNDISFGKLLIIRDISLQKKAEQLMLNSKTIDSLGRLAGGIAHDFNNLLCGIVSNLSLAKMKLEPLSEVAELIEISEKTALGARDLARQLLTFSNVDSKKIEIFDLIELLNETSSFLAHGSNIFISVDLPQKPVFIEADRCQIRQVFQNIIINGLESMSSGQTLHIAGNVVYLQKIDAPYNKEGEYFKISIADQGNGINVENLSRIFEPYFTTKQNGNGLGLAIVNSVISRNHGSISVDSQINKGSVFTVFLPVLKNAERHQFQHSVNTSIKPGRILIMDDSHTVRLSLALLLQQMGYTVDQACSGNQAIELFEQSIHNKCFYQAVITDLIVHGAMGGKELARELKNRDPYLKIIASSGYSEEIDISRFRDFGFAGVLYKPYSTEELKNALDSVFSFTQSTQSV
ncbi:MAG TPA: ATP-binding protein [Chitinispirillaceae bacterium]|nr:ATP-binding protein [Chitinispirillaceae bacterium]